MSKVAGQGVPSRALLTELLQVLSQWVFRVSGNSCGLGNDEDHIDLPYFMPAL